MVFAFAAELTYADPEPSGDVASPVNLDVSTLDVSTPDVSTTGVSTTGSADDELSALAVSYFQADSSRQRASIATKISRMDGITINAVADTIRHVQVWTSQPAGIHRFAIETVRKRARIPHITRIHISVPETYAPSKAYPLLLALPPQNADSEQYLRFAMKLLGDRANEFIIAVPTDYQGVWLGSSPEAVGDPSALLDTIKRRYHVDTDRVYVMGTGRGGHASFVLAALHTDFFAASIPLAGTFALELGSQAVDLLLPNVQPVPMLVVYAEPGSDEHADNGSQLAGIAEWNRYISHVAERLELPIRTVEQEVPDRADIVPPPDLFAEVLGQTRRHDIKRFDHWFRYPAQGRMSWVRLTRFKGEPWTAQQIVVAPAMGETASEAITQILEDRLAYIGGEIDGQTIRVHTRRCDRIDLMLNDELIDLDEDITIYLDGTKRFEGRAKRRIQTLLDVAREDWDFQRLWPVRFQISRKGRAIQY